LAAARERPGGLDEWMTVWHPSTHPFIHLPPRQPKHHSAGPCREQERSCPGTHKSPRWATGHVRSPAPCRGQEPTRAAERALAASGAGLPHGDRSRLPGPPVPWTRRGRYDCRAFARKRGDRGTTGLLGALPATRPGFGGTGEDGRFRAKAPTRLCVSMLPAAERVAVGTTLSRGSGDVRAGSELWRKGASDGLFRAKESTSSHPRAPGRALPSPGPRRSGGFPAPGARPHG